VSEGLSLRVRERLHVELNLEDLKDKGSLNSNGLLAGQSRLNLKENGLVGHLPRLLALLPGDHRLTCHNERLLEPFLEGKYRKKSESIPDMKDIEVEPFHVRLRDTSVIEGIIQDSIIMVGDGIIKYRVLTMSIIIVSVIFG
jgi:hypothetical protein